MINYKTRPIESNYVVSMMCDCCKKGFDDVLDTQEFVHINDVGGFSSAIGDEVRYQCDLCSMCVKRILGKYLRYPDIKPLEGGE